MQTLEELATPAVSLQKWEFQENSHMLETISGSIKFSLSLSLFQCREQAEKQGSKRKKSTILDTSEVSTYTTTYLLTYQQELPICFPPPSSDLKTATSKGILQIRRQDRVAAADSPRLKKCGKNGLKFGESLVPERGPSHCLRCWTR